MTDQRLAVLGALSKSRRPRSFPELVDRLGDHGLDRATVYRTLVSLTEAGILIRTQLGDGVARYELPHHGESLHTKHLHLVCLDCGGVSCLPPTAVSLHGEAALRVTEVQLRGHCGACSH